MSKVVCVACRHTIDASARLCPYCGANPVTGEKVDTEAVLQQIFHPRQLSTGETVLDFARQRQGIIIAAGIFGVFLLFAAVHRFITIRNNTAVANSAAVPLTDVADLSNQPDETKPLPLPDLPMQYTGRSQTMRTFIVEPGAIKPPEVVAAEQAAAQEAAAKAAAQQQARPGATPAAPGAAPATPGVAQPAQPRPMPAPQPHR
jgi:hypothetical protein